MNSTVESISTTKKKIIIEATADEVEGRIQKALKDLRVKTKLPGFRPGKVPIPLIDKKYGKEVEKDVLERLIPEYYLSAIKEAKLSPVTNPEFEKSDYKRKEDLRLVCSVEVRPEIEGFQYEGLPLKEIEIKVEDSEVEQSLKELLKSKSTYEPVEKAVQKNDLVVIDYEVKNDNMSYQDQFLKVGADTYPDVFSDALIGKNKDESIEINATLPDNFIHQELREKTLDLNVTIKGVKELVIPELDDEFAKDVGVDTLAELRQKIREGLEGSKKEYAVKEKKGELVKSLVEKYDFELPETLLNAELKAFINGIKEKEEFKDKSDEELKEEFQDKVISNVKAMIILDTIGEKENIEVTDDELKQRIFVLSKMMNMTPEALVQLYNSREGAFQELRNMIYREKIADLLYSKAEIQKGD